MKRSIVINVLPENLNVRRKIIDSIRLYRAAARKAFAACAMAEMAGAEIIERDGDLKIIPHTDGAKTILKSAFGVDGKAHLYELRLWLRELHPTWMSIVPESLHRDIVSPRWRAKDPEFPKATRGYLTLNGVRGMAQFNKTGIYFKNTIPRIAERTVTLRWDYDIGDVVLKIIDMDPSRWHVWKNIVDKTEGWKLGGTYLKERDGKLILIIGYECPDKEQSLDSGRVLCVEFTDNPELFITTHTEDKKFSGDAISVSGAMAWAKEIESIRGAYLQRLASYGSPRKRWGSKRLRAGVCARLERLTARRANGEKSHNHLWTRRIVENAIRCKTGRVVVVNTPEREMFGIFWGWYQFKQMLKYKIEEVGGKIEFVELKEAKTA